MTTATTPAKKIRTTVQHLRARPGLEEEITLSNWAIDMAKAAAESMLDGSLKPSEGNVLLGGGRLVAGVVTQSFARRANIGRVLAQEAKLIEAETKESESEETKAAAA